MIRQKELNRHEKRTEGRAKMGDDESTDRPVRYEIRVAGILDSSWSDWFEQMTISTEESGGRTITAFSGPVVDHAALHGILNKIWDLNLDLISVAQVADTPLAAETGEVGRNARIGGDDER